MKKADLKEFLLDRPANTQIVLSQYLCEEEPEYDKGWEVDIFRNDEWIGGGTAPTVSGAYDIAQEIIWDEEHPSKW